MTAPSPPNALAAGVLIGVALHQAGIPYALGGALAYGVWGIPRATLDVDVNVFVEEDRLDQVVGALRAAGVQVTLEQARSGARDEGMFVGWLCEYRVDVFTPSVDFSWEAARTRVERSVGDQKVFFLSAEALAVFKLLFHRPKDLVDLERLVAVRGEKLDAAWVRAQIVTAMGEGDERVRSWDRIVTEHAPSG